MSFIENIYFLGENG